MTKTLYLAWQDPGKKRAWYPIGRLDTDPQNLEYKFAYTRGALKAHAEAQFNPLVSFPNFDEVYRSPKLFPLFRNRVIPESRADFRDYLKRLDLPKSMSDPLSILAVSGGERQTDSLEVFPRLEAAEDGSFKCRFFLHGWRHVSAHAQERLGTLCAGDNLRVAIEVNNPATEIAIQLQTEGDYCMLGWTPRYLVHDLVKVISEAPTVINASVARINPVPAPTRQRILIEMRGTWPANFDPMSDDEFRLIKAVA